MYSVAVGHVAGHGLAVHFEREGVAEHRATLHGERNLLEVLDLQFTRFAGSDTLEEGAVTWLGVFGYGDESASVSLVVEVARKEHALAHDAAESAGLQVCEQQNLAVLRQRPP